jgi:hypothetical protein
VGPRIAPQPPSSPGLTRGSSRPHRPRKRCGGLDGRVKLGHDEAEDDCPRTSPFDRLRVRSNEGASEGALPRTIVVNLRPFRGEVLPTPLMVRCERSEPRTMRGQNPSAGRLPPPCGEGSGVGVARCSPARGGCDLASVFLAKMDSRLRGNDTGLGSAVGPKFVPQPPSSPGLTGGPASLASRARCAVGWMAGSGPAMTGAGFGLRISPFDRLRVRSACRAMGLLTPALPRDPPRFVPPPLGENK